MTSDLTAYDLFLRGRSETYRLSPESTAAAVELLERAVALDPEFAAAHAYLSQAYMAVAVLSPSAGGFAGPANKALRAAETAVACDESLGLAHAFLAWSQVWLRRYAEANASFERALGLAPNDVEVLGHYATSLNYSGEPERALSMFDLAGKLDPLLPPHLRFARGVSLFLLRRNEEAVEALRVAIQLAPALAAARYVCAAALSELGRGEEARAEAFDARQAMPAASFIDLIQRVPFRDERYRERIAAGLRATGVFD